MHKPLVSSLCLDPCSQWGFQTCFGLRNLTGRSAALLGLQEVLLRGQFEKRFSTAPISLTSQGQSQSHSQSHLLKVTR